MDLKVQKRLAAQIMHCGVSRVRVTANKEVDEAITRQDIRELIQKGFIVKVQKKGSHRREARHTLSQKQRGRRKGPGSKKGKAGSRQRSKDLWMKQVRGQRNLLKELRSTGRIKAGSYAKTYLKVKGSMFRSRRHLMSYLQENELLQAKPKK